MFAVAPMTMGQERPVAVRPPASTSVLRSLVRLHELLANARVIWLSTTRPDGRPHVVPTWFDWDGEHITVFTRPHAQKVRNVRHEPRVMVAIGCADLTFEVELLEAEAEVVDAPEAEAQVEAGAVPASQVEASAVPASQVEASAVPAPRAEAAAGKVPPAERPLTAPRPGARFAAKYADALREEGRSVEAFAADYPSALRIRPTRLLDWGARG